MSGGWSAADGRLGVGAGWYARELGWKVFPCWGIVDGKCECGQVHPEPKDQGKHPLGRLVPDGQTSATCEVGVVAGWWETEPDANIGVVCRESGLVVIDVDPRNGGLDAWARLEELCEGALPDTVEAQTGVYTVKGGRVERGRHLYYKVAEDETLKGAIDGLKGIDVKHRGYVLVAPSRHASGVIYEWREGHAPWEMEIAEAPEELLALLRKKARGAGGGAGSGYGIEIEWGGEKLDVEGILQAGIHEGERDNLLYRVACSMANDIDVDKPWLVAGFKQMIKGINASRVVPPLPDEDVDRICRQALKLVEESPRVTLAEKLEPEVVAWAARRRADGVEANSSGGGGGGGGGSGMPLNPDAVEEADGGVVGRRSMTDLGNGRRIVDYAGDRIRYTGGVGWHVWNGEYWVPDGNGGRVHEISKGLPVWVGSELAGLEDGDEARADELVKWAHKTRSIPARRNAVADAQTDERIQVPVSAWDADPHKLGVRNGVINLRTGDLLPNDPALHITRQSRVAYTPGQTNIRWSEFLDFATGGDKELQRFIQLAAGYTLTGDRHHECLFLVYGPPGSGKSTLLECIGTLLGDYYLPMDSDVLVETVGTKSSTEYHMAQMMGRRMIGISEWPEGRATKEDAIKRLTGDTMISGRHPGERPFQFMSQAKLWVGTNVKPRISERAMWRRIRAINFSHVPERPDPDLKSYLLDPEGALSAVLSWAVEGAVMLLGSRERQPLAQGASRHVMDATRAYEESEDKFGMFMHEELRAGEGLEVSVMSVFRRYTGWVAARGEREPKYYTVARIMEEKGLRLSGSGNTMMLHGWALPPVAVVDSGDVSWTGLVDSSRTRT